MTFFHLMNRNLLHFDTKHTRILYIQHRKLEGIAIQVYFHNIGQIEKSNGRTTKIQETKRRILEWLRKLKYKEKTINCLKKDICPIWI